MSYDVNAVNHTDHLKYLVVDELNKKFKLKDAKTIKNYLRHDNESKKDKFNRIKARIVHILKFKFQWINDSYCEKTANRCFNERSIALCNFYTAQASTIDGAKQFETSIRTAHANVKSIVKIFENTLILPTVEQKLNLKNWEDLIDKINRELNRPVDPEPVKPEEKKPSEKMPDDQTTSGQTQSGQKTPDDQATTNSTGGIEITPDPTNSSDQDDTKAPDQKTSTTNGTAKPGKSEKKVRTPPEPIVFTPISQKVIDEVNAHFNTIRSDLFKKAKTEEATNDTLPKPDTLNSQMLNVFQQKNIADTDETDEDDSNEFDDDFVDVLSEQNFIATTSEGDFQCTFQKNEDGEVLVIKGKDEVTYHQVKTKTGSLRPPKHYKNGFDHEGYDKDGFAADGFDRNDNDKNGKDINGEKRFQSSATSKTQEEKEEENKCVPIVFRIIMDQANRVNFRKVIPSLISVCETANTLNPDGVYNVIRNGKFDDFITEQNKPDGLFGIAGIKVPTSTKRYKKRKPKSTDKSAGPSPADLAAQNKQRIPAAFANGLKAALGITTLKHDQLNVS